MKCPKCGSDRTQKYGHTRHGKKRRRCCDCNYQFKVESDFSPPVSKPSKPSVSQLLEVFNSLCERFESICDRLERMLNPELLPVTPGFVNEPRSYKRKRNELQPYSGIQLELFPLDLHLNQPQELGSSGDRIDEVREQPQELHPNQSQELGSNDDRFDEVREQPQELHPNQSQELGNSCDRIEEVREQPQELTTDSEILDRLIKQACKVLSTEEWEADYSGYDSKLRLWEVVVLDKDGCDVGSLFFERIQTAEDFVTIDSLEDYYWFGRRQGYCWQADKNLSIALHESNLLSDLRRLAQPFLSEVKRELLQSTEVTKQPQELHPNQSQELGSSDDRIEEVREQPQELHPNQSQELGSSYSLTVKHIEKIKTRLKGKGCDFHFIRGWLEEKLVKGNPYIYYRCRHPDTRKLLSIYVGKV